MKNIHFADDVLKTKFLEVYVSYQERLFHVDHEIRDLTNQYVQADQQTLSDKEAAKFLARGLKLQGQHTGQTPLGLQSRPLKAASHAGQNLLDKLAIDLREDLVHLS